MRHLKIASVKDVKGILDIQQELLVPPSDLREEDMSRGFLIHTTPRKLLEDIILNPEKSFVLVSKDDDTVIGYVIVYRLNHWISLHAEWKNAVSNVDSSLVSFHDHEFYIQHIARDPRYRGLGVSLLFGAKQEIINRGGTHLFGDILEKPVCNRASKEFHEKTLGAKKIGAYKEEPNLEWGIYRINFAE